MLTGRRILLIITGGIAAYKALELIRLIKKANGQIRVILTKGGAEFVTPLSISALSGEKVYEDLFSLTDESEMGHIRLSRESDLIVVAPASADFLAKIVHGRADDLASTVILAADKPVLVAPAMNPMMWTNPATQSNIATLKSRNIDIIGPDGGDMACGEIGDGRMSEPEAILAAIQDHFAKNKPLAGKRAIVTSGPTYEPIDPVRFIGNRSSGKQGHAIAQALADAGAAVTLVTGPVSLPDPRGVHTVHIETAADMQAALETALTANGQVDIAVYAAAVADWRVENISDIKMKKRSGGTPPDLRLVETTDLLKYVGTLPANQRPRYVVGFAAETDNLLENATRKLQSKNCDLILANDVSNGAVFGQDETHIHAVTKDGAEDWGVMDKITVARELATRIMAYR